MNEPDTLNTEIQINKINNILTYLAKTKYNKKITYENVSIYFYENKIDLFIKPEIEKKVWEDVLKELPIYENYNIIVNGKKIKEHSYDKLNFEKINNIISEIKNLKTFKIRLNSEKNENSDHFF